MHSMATVERRMTYRDLARWPDDGLRHELLDGEHVVTPSPGTQHQQTVKRVFRLLDRHVERHRLGEVLFAPFDIKLSLFTVVVPDLVYFTAERYARVVNEKHATAAPDLVVEVLSPGTRRRDRGRKRAIYEREGVGEYWIVDPVAQDVAVLRRPTPDAGFTTAIALSHARHEVLASPLFPGLRIRLDRIFR